jgi:hypothetical protein
MGQFRLQRSLITRDESEVLGKPRVRAADAKGTERRPLAGTSLRCCETALCLQIHLPRESFDPSNRLALDGASRYCVGVNP